MKAVVMEVGSRHTVAMTGRGEYVRLKTLPRYQVGCEIEYNPASYARQWARYARAAAALVLCIGIGGFMYIFATPYSYVNLDINPSVEVAVNRFDYIIRAKGMNEDGSALLLGQSVLNKPLADGVDILLEQLERGAYLQSAGESALVFTIVSEDQSKIALFDQTIREAVSRELPAQSNVEVYVIHAGFETHKNAAKHNLSSGRFLLMQELKRTTDRDLDPAAMGNIPIAEAVKTVRGNSPKADDDEGGSAGRSLLKRITPQKRQSREQQDGRQTREQQDGRQTREQQDGRQSREQQEKQQSQKRQDRPQSQEQQGSPQKQERLDRQQGKQRQEKQPGQEGRNIEKTQEGQGNRLEQGRKDIKRREGLQGNQ